MNIQSEEIYESIKKLTEINSLKKNKQQFLSNIKKYNKVNDISDILIIY